MYISPIVLCIAVIAACFHQLIKFTSRYLSLRRMKAKHGCLPPRKIHQKDPLLGSDIVLQNLAAARNHGFLALLRNRHKQNGLTFTTNTFLRTTINTCDPKLIQCVLALQFEDFGMGPLRRKSASTLLGKGIFTSDDEHWAHQRALIRPSFVRAQVSDFDILQVHVDQLLQLIKQESYTVDLQLLFYRLILDFNTEYMFGESVGLLSGNASDAANTFHGALDYAQDGVIFRLRLGKIMWLHRDIKFKDTCNIIHIYADKYVARALEHRRQQKLRPSDIDDKESNESNKKIFLYELAKDSDDPIVLRDQIVNMILAARDTTSGLLAFTFYMLARHSQVFKKLRAEVLEHYCDPLTYEAVMEMTYLRFVLHEILRLFPPISTNSRMAKHDTIVPMGGGPDGQSPMLVKKDNVISYSTFVMHRREEFFGSDAHEFRPERWESLRPGWEFLPFNGGPRICPGQKLALTESSYIVARLLHAFEAVESLDQNEEWVEQLTLSLTLNNGCKVKLTPA